MEFLAGENLLGGLAFPLPNCVPSMVVVVHEQIELPLSHVILCGVEVYAQVRERYPIT